MLVLLYAYDELNLGPLGYLGRASYSTYLVHQKMGVMLIGLLCGGLGMPDLVGLAAAVVAAMALGCLLHEIVELPSQRWLLKLWHARGPNKLGPTMLERPAD